ncbi:MAG: hypothetical protein AABY16_02825 [Nanoarchaeota archaeon]
MKEKRVRSSGFDKKWIFIAVVGVIAVLLVFAVGIYPNLLSPNDTSLVFCFDTDDGHDIPTKGAGIEITIPAAILDEETHTSPYGPPYSTLYSTYTLQNGVSIGTSTNNPNSNSGSLPATYGGKSYSIGFTVHPDTAVLVSSADEQIEGYPPGNIYLHEEWSGPVTVILPGWVSTSYLVAGIHPRNQDTTGMINALGECESLETSVFQSSSAEIGPFKIPISDQVIKIPKFFASSTP